MPRRTQQESLYADRYCADGVIASGWRRVRKDGLVKFGGFWFGDDQLADIAGELVYVHMGDYWMSNVDVHRGAVGCLDFFCRAVQFDFVKNSTRKDP